MAFQRHRFQALGHVGFIDPVQVNRGARLLEQHVHHAAQVSAGRVTQVRQGLARLPRQGVKRRAVGSRLDIGRQHLVPQREHLVAARVELKGLRVMVVGDQQVAAALDQAQHGVMHIQRDQPAFEGPEFFAQAADPGRKKGKGQRVRHRELDHVLADRCVAAQHGARRLQALQHVQ